MRVQRRHNAFVPQHSSLCAFFHSPLSRGVPEQRWGTAELEKLAGLLFVFLGPKIGGSDLNS